MIININNPPLHAVEISRQGENAFREIEIDVSSWLAEYPDGKISVIYCRPDGELYPVIVNATESTIVWRPTATDTAAAGNGAIEVRIQIGDVLGKSCTIAAKVLGALGAPGDAPAAPAPDWARQVAEDAASAAAAAEKAEAASTHMPQISASKTWLVWDADAGEYVDTGVPAAGAKGDDGDPGKAPIIGSNGNWYEWDDAAGAYTDTGKPSRGEKGETGAAGADGNDGRDGTDGITPTIGENGNWYLGATDTGKPSRGKDGATGATGATGEKGADGKSAYQYAVDGGYAGTEEEFAAKLAAEMPDKLPNPNALTFTGAVEGSYDGSEPLSVEIPSGGGASTDGGVGTGTYEFSVLASGTIPANTITALGIGNSMIDTGITLGMLRQYKIFNMLYRCDSANQYYCFAVGEPGAALYQFKRFFYHFTNAMNSTILWIDSARTAVLMLCSTGNTNVTSPAIVELMGKFGTNGLASGGASMSSINSYGNFADISDEAKIYVGVMHMNGQATNTKDFTWAICGVIK